VVSATACLTIGSCTLAHAEGREVSVSVRPHVVRLGHTVTINGQAAGAPAGTDVRLYERTFPFRHGHLKATVTTGADRSFSFTVRPDRDTRFHVIVAGSGRSTTLPVAVLAKAPARVRALPLGRARVSIVVYHPRGLRWGHARVSWSVASGRSHRFTREPSTRSVRLSPYADRLTSVVTLPAGHFRWRACMKVPAAGALLDPRRPPSCHSRGYEGAGSLPVGFPGPVGVAHAASYLHRRAGRTAFAVIDSEGRLSGVHMHWTFVSASVVKAMLLVAYLRMLDAEGRHRIDSYSNSFLYPMIHVSDNDAATKTWSIVGNGQLYALAHAAHMTDYSVYTDWASSQISAADQARFFFEMNSLIPPEFRRYARFLLSTIAGDESWGIPAVARPRGYQVFFKGGWRGTNLGQLVHQVGRVVGHGRTFSMAVMTDGDPSMGYGISTIQGVTAALL
jgi:hypothetical protein